MKKYLLTLILFASVGLMAEKLQAQCTVSNVAIKINGSSPSGSNCLVNVDFSFDLTHNNGNKFFWIHLWTSASYPSLSYQKPPTAAELILSLANIGVNDNTGGAPVLQTSYPPATSVPVESTGLTLSVVRNGASDRFTVSGITLLVPGGCSSVINITGDLWSSQSASQNAVHCFTQGISFVANDPTVRGTLFCPSPRHYNVNITTLSSTTLSGTYNVYVDNGDGIFDPSTDSLVKTNVPWSASSSTQYNSGSQTYNGNSQKPYADHDLWVEVTTTGLSNKTVGQITNGCIPLPVSFISFDAKRSSASNVGLSWQTATEINNRGFAVERSINGSWQQVAFVPSQAPGGNSNSTITYQYSDLNSSKGISQYRIKQVDLDGKATYSEIRAVRGLDQPIKTIVYPNPSFDGRVNVVFEDALGIRDIVLSDMSGRVVKNWNGVSNNNLQIDNLTPGFYSLRVVVRETGAQTVEKIVVNKR